MPKPDDTALSITPDALKTASAHCMANPDVESCGFIVGRGGVGNRVIAVLNVSGSPADSFEMHHQGILDSMGDADRNNEDIIAVYHSHPTSEAIPSELDKAVPDIDPAQLIISLKDGQPRCRAWRLDVPFLGERRATEVMVHLSDDGQPFLMKPPVLPWALTPGNQVLISYKRIGHPGERVISTKIIGHGGEPTNPSVRFDTVRKTEPRVMDVNRIRGVTVVKESVAAQRVRHKMVMLARRAAYLMSEQQYEDVPEILAVLTAAFPIGIVKPIAQKEETA